MRLCVVVERKFLYALNAEQRSALHRLITIKPSKGGGGVGWVMSKLALNVARVVIESSSRAKPSRVEPCSQLGRPPPVAAAAAAAVKTKPEVDDDEGVKMGTACTATCQYPESRLHADPLNPSPPPPPFLFKDNNAVREARVHVTNTTEEEIEKNGGHPCETIGVPQPGRNPPAVSQHWKAVN